MKKPLLFFSFIIHSLFSLETPSTSLDSLNKNLSFTLLVTGYNNIDFYERNLESIFSQDYPHYKVIIVDDGSTDGTYEGICNWITTNQPLQNHILIRSENNQGKLKHYYDIINSCAKDEIICLIDGDDFLSGPNVLDILARYYNDPNTWLTFGQYLHHPSGNMGNCEKILDEDLSEQNIRKLPWLTSHLKTFYAGLFQKIDIEDLKFEGKFITSAIDLAIMFPMVDMATTHSIYISEILYHYNNLNPISHHKVTHGNQRYFNKYTRSLSTYPKLKQSPAQ